MTQWQTKPVTDPVIQWVGKTLGCDLQTGPWIAGGTPRLLWNDESWWGHDIDVFVSSMTGLERLQTKMKQISWPAHQTRNAYTYNLEHAEKTHKVQIICKDFHRSLAQLFSYFDFTVCKFATDGNLIVADQQTVADCERRELVWNTTSPQGLSTYRVIKYSAYGFDIDNQMLDKLVKRYQENPLQFNVDADYEG